jgi:hypothetical protein
VAWVDRAENSGRQVYFLVYGIGSCSSSLSLFMLFYVF